MGARVALFAPRVQLAPTTSHGKQAGNEGAPRQGRRHAFETVSAGGRERIPPTGTKRRLLERSQCGGCTADQGNCERKVPRDTLAVQISNLSESGPRKGLNF